MNKQFKEPVLWALILLPYVYLWSIWAELPEIVPTHFNMKGVADDWSSKKTLLLIPGALGLFIYILMLIIPRVDPKKKIDQMGDKYYNLRFILTLFISLLSIYLLNLSKTGSFDTPNLMLALMGALFAMLGNYFQTVRPNYFIGIRTPWTLENETVWKETHRMGGRIWMAGGILIALLAFIIRDGAVFSYIFLTIVLLMVFIPAIFSYIRFNREKKSPEKN